MSTTILEWQPCHTSAEMMGCHQVFFLFFVIKKLIFICVNLFQGQLIKDSLSSEFEKIDTNGNVMFGHGLECNVLVACLLRNFPLCVEELYAAGGYPTPDPGFLQLQSQPCTHQVAGHPCMCSILTFKLSTLNVYQDMCRGL